MRKKRNLFGKKFNRWEVISEHSQVKTNKQMWLCKCECGTERFVRGHALTSGRSKSCGCFHREKMKSITSGSSNPMYGRKHSIETRLKISRNLPDISGNRNPRWRSDLTEKDRMDRRILPEYKEWREEVFKRDNYTCVCGKRGGALEAHHLESYSRNRELSFSVDNGVTLCKKHHRRFHTEYGCIDNNKVQSLKFIGGINYASIERR